MQNPEGLSKKNKAAIVIGIIGIAALLAFAGFYHLELKDRSTAIHYLTADQLYQFINQSCQCIPIIDIRPSNEYFTGHLNHSYNLYYQDSKFMETMRQFDKNSPIVIYCQHGSRSENASRMLRDDGFKYIYTLIGGIDSWMQKGYPVK